MKPPNFLKSQYPSSTLPTVKGLGVIQCCAGRASSCEVLSTTRMSFVKMTHRESWVAGGYSRYPHTVLGYLRGLDKPRASEKGPNSC
jgi:hypothetical protein